MSSRGRGTASMVAAGIMTTFLTAATPAAAAQAHAPAAASPARDVVAGNLIRFNDNAGWSWFEDERAIVDRGHILMSSVANRSGVDGPTRGGNVELSAFDLATRRTTTTVFGRFEGDDHDSAAILGRPDGRYLAVYSRHNLDDRTRYRISTNIGDASSWGAERTFHNGAPTTYSNLAYLTATGKTYLFDRSKGGDPNIAVSGDHGTTWASKGVLVRGPDHTPTLLPYLKYASNGVDRIYFISTQGHPAQTNSSVFSGYFDGTHVHRMDGSLVRAATNASTTAPHVTDLTPVMRAQTEGVAGHRTHVWVSDLAIGADGNPRAILSWRRESDDDRATPEGKDDRFSYARWTGTEWQLHELAAAGAGLVAHQPDFTGLASFDPNDLDTVFMSTSVDPTSGASLAHHEIYRGATRDSGATWSWTAITERSTVENLRPIVPAWSGHRRAVLWLRGSYTWHTDYRFAVVGLVETPGRDPATNAEYVDATASNTSALSGAAFIGPSGSRGATDDRWHRRTGAGNLGNVLTADERGREDAPLLRTRVGSLPGGRYDVWVEFWSPAGRQWQIRAGLGRRSLARFLRWQSQSASKAGLIGASTDRIPGAGLQLYRAYLGRIGLDGTMPLDVFVDDGSGKAASRTWYDGISYARVP